MIFFSVRKYEELIKQKSDNKTSKENGESPVKRTEAKPEISIPEENEVNPESSPDESEVTPTEEPPQECCDLTLNFSRQAISDDGASDKGDDDIDPLEDSAEQQGSRSYEVEDTRDGYKSDDQHLNDDGDNDDLFAGLPKASSQEDEGGNDDLFAGLPTEEQEENEQKEKEEEAKNEEKEAENIEKEQDNESTGEEEPPAESCSLDDFYASLG